MMDWKKDRKKPLFTATLIFFIIGQISLFIIFFNYGEALAVKYSGYICWILSAILGWLPIYELKKQGGVLKGKSYVETTKLVTSGIYGIVRHPQFLGGIFLSIALMLISQHWSVMVFGLPLVVILYKVILEADKSGVEKFGNSYIKYMKEVPRINFISGLIRALKK